MKKFRSFLAGLLLVPVLAFAGPLSYDSDASGVNSEKPVAGACWVFFMGRWIQIPC
jgi:hypothetical protein